MKTIDLNADLGEGYGDYRIGDDAGMLGIVSSANIACGFHAGDPSVMEQTMRLAVQHGVSIGAHIGYPDKQGFGRRHIAYDTHELYLMTLYQLGAASAIARSVGGRLSHANFHGALGNLSFVDLTVAEAVLRAVKDFDPSLKFVALPHTAAHAAAWELGIPIVASFLADRAYTAEGTLVSRKQPDAVIHDSDIICARVQRAVLHGEIETVDGTILEMPVDSILVHGDTAGALDIARKVREAVLACGAQVASFA